MSSFTEPSYWKVNEWKFTTGNLDSASWTYDDSNWSHVPGLVNTGPYTVLATASTRFFQLRK